MHRRDFLKASLAASVFPGVSHGSEKRDRLALMDMVHFNPGEPAPATRFLEPGYVSGMGYSAIVIQSPIEGVPTFDSVAPGAIGIGSIERVWAEQKRQEIGQRIEDAHRAGLKVYAWMQLVVLPKSVLTRFRGAICNAEGRIDVERPMTQKVIATQLREIFELFPLLDGLVIRTGEVYMQDLPHHASTGGEEGTRAIQQSTAILHGQESHVSLLQVLRDVVCVQSNRKVFYRTWDFGSFHTKPEVYLGVTERIDPHENLVFSIKHQAGDFHQLTPFNPTLTLGRHPQIVEVQCQREAYGKGAHPYYIGSGVIDGWEDMAWINPRGRAKGLRGILKSANFRGVWTWSRGGGWEGPYIKNELWCALNAMVMTEWATEPQMTEATAFQRAAMQMGVPSGQVGLFHQMNLLATKAVLRGQLSAIPTSVDDPLKIDVWWARDDKLDNPDLSDFVRRGLVERSLAEKRTAVQMWRQVVQMGDELQLRDAGNAAFVRSSCRYGLMKYSAIEAGWTATLLAQESHLRGGALDKARIGSAIQRWDRVWAAWKAMAVRDPLCSTLVRPQAFDIDFKYKPGLGAAVDALRGR